MGIGILLKSIANMSRAEAAGMDVSNAVPIPKAAADPSAVAEFANRMQQGVNTDNNISGKVASQSPETLAGKNNLQTHQTMNDNNSASPMTLGERLGSARINKVEDSSTKKWLNSITDIIEKDVISHTDLYQVQVLASLSKIEVAQNCSFNKGLNDGLKNVLKNN